ncbi:SGNH/GDSL hydrolase family protein [Pirellulales bacterium]|nr:SGNH/GDSL hydrolase family protein [Pirellulales bacterium]
MTFHRFKTRCLIVTVVCSLSGGLAGSSLADEAVGRNRQSVLNGNVQLHSSAIEQAARVVAPDVRENRRQLLHRAERIVFLGDSITHEGRYAVMFDAWLLTHRLPKPPMIINVGLPSETVSGLSEPGHADGKFPRPDLDERLDRVLEKTSPDLVFACYGINCGIYQPFSDERFDRFQQGIKNLRKKAEAAGATVVHITPPVYDGRNADRTNIYDAVMDRYSNWLLAQRDKGWLVVDLHRPMADEFGRRSTADPSFTLQRDRVHPNEAGHWFIAQQLFRWFGDLEAALAESPDALLANAGLSPEVLPLVRERSQLLRDAYLSAAGHLRPGVQPGLPVNEATQKADQLASKIRESIDPASSVD